MIHHNLPYHILDKQSVQNLYKEHFIFCYKLSEAYVEKNISFQTEKEKLLFIKKLQAYFVFCLKYNMSEKEIEKTLKNVKTISQLNTLFKIVRKSLQGKKAEERKILLKGQIKRHLYDYHNNDFFQNQQRIYIKINKTPSLSLFIQESISFLNQYLLSGNKIKLLQKEKTVFLTGLNNQKQKKSIQQYFVSEDDKQEIKIGKFLENLYQKLKLITLFINKKTDKDFLSFIKLFETEDSYSKKFQQKLNQFFIENKLKPVLLSPTLFSLIKYASGTSKQEFEKYLSFFCNEILKIKTEIHQIQTKSPENIQNSATYNEGDLIILSVHPKDIARVSEYTDWETCMSYDGEKAYDLSFQIGVGSIVAYLVNSKNPYKKLARILLKPYVNASDLAKQKKRLNSFYQGENKFKLKEMDYLLESSSKRVYKKHKMRLFLQYLQRTLPLTPQKTLNQMYFADQQFGLQNSLFSAYIKEITRRHLNTKNNGAFFVLGDYYRDNLAPDYFIADKENTDHCIQFLNMRKCPFNSTIINGKRYITVKTIYAKDVPNLNLSGVNAEHITMQAADLSLIDERGLSAKNLTLENCESRLYLPENLKVKETLTLHGTNLNTIQNKIKIRELVVNCPNLQFIPENIEVQSLSIVSTKITKLPNLTLTSLSAAYSQIKDLRNVTVTDKLILTGTPIQHLRNSMHLSSLDLNKCNQLKKLPVDLFVKSLNISNTNLSNIPPLHYDYLIINNNQSFEKLPQGVSFDNLEAQNTPLQELPSKVSANYINISQSAVKNLPTDLRVYELHINKTDISTLPSSMVVKKLSAKNTKISVIPANIQIQNLDLRDSFIETIHYSKDISLINVSELPKFIHPALSSNIFPKFDKKEILKSKQRYLDKYLCPIRINNQKILGPYQIKTNIFSRNLF